MSKAEDFARPYRVSDGRRFRLRDFDPADTAGLKDKQAAAADLKKGVEKLSELQEKLYAQDSWSVLLVFQAMDAAGKDGAIKHVMSGVNPQGVQVFSFKAPSPEELDHDFLWRAARSLPERGRIGIFNRSYYEEVLVVRVHEEFLNAQRLPARLVGKAVWKQRCEDISRFERYLSRNGVAVLKFFLHVSKGEQKKRFLERLDEPAKNWKFSSGDVKERGHWDEYMQAYEFAIQRTATPWAPWYVVPADNKWFTRLVVARAVIDCLQDLKVRFPEVGPAQKRELEKSRALLNARRVRRA